MLSKKCQVKSRCKFTFWRKGWRRVTASLDNPPGFVYHSLLFDRLACQVRETPSGFFHFFECPFDKQRTDGSQNSANGKNPMDNTIKECCPSRNPIKIAHLSIKMTEPTKDLSQWKLVCWLIKSCFPSRVPQYWTVSTKMSIFWTFKYDYAKWPSLKKRGFYIL